MWPVTRGAAVAVERVESSGCAVVELRILRLPPVVLFTATIISLLFSFELFTCSSGHDVTTTSRGRVVDKDAAPGTEPVHERTHGDGQTPTQMVCGGGGGPSEPRRATPWAAAEVG